MPSNHRVRDWLSASPFASEWNGSSVFSGKYMAHGHGAAHGGEGDTNKKIAIFISIIALFLAIAETFAKSAQTEA